MRTWTNPAWGESLEVVRSYHPDWMNGEWTQHLGFEIAVWAMGFLVFGLIDPFLDLVLQSLSLTGFLDILSSR